MDIAEVRRVRLGQLKRQYRTWAEINRRLGRSVRDSTLSQILNRAPDSKSKRPRSMGTPQAREIEAKLNLPHGWLDRLDEVTGGVAEPVTFPYRVSEPPAPGYVRLPVMAEAAAGAGRITTEPEVVQHIDVLESWARRTFGAGLTRVRVLTARGRSMTGTIEDGDLMFVEPCARFDGDGIYVLSVEDYIRVKRLRLLAVERKLSIESTDGSPPEVVPLSAIGELIRIQGRVVGAWTLRRF